MPLLPAIILCVLPVPDTSDDWPLSCARCRVPGAECALRLLACREAEVVRAQLQAAGARAEGAEAAAASARAAAAAAAQREGERIRCLEVSMR